MRSIVMIALCVVTGLSGQAQGAGLDFSDEGRRSTAAPGAIQILGGERDAFLLSRRNALTPLSSSRSPQRILNRLGITANNRDWVEETARGVNELRLHHFKYGGLGELGGSLNGDDSNIRLKFGKRW